MKGTERKDPDEELGSGDAQASSKSDWRPRPAAVKLIGDEERRQVPTRILGREALHLTSASSSQPCSAMVVRRGGEDELQECNWETPGESDRKAINRQRG